MKKHLKKTTVCILIFSLITVLFVSCSSDSEEHNAESRNNTIVNSGDVTYSEQSTSDATIEKIYEPYTAYVADYSNSAGIGSIEFKKSKGKYRSNDAPKQLTIEFDGKEYTGDYEYTDIFELCSYENHVYRINNIEDKRGYFAVFTDDLSLERFILRDKDYRETQPLAPDVDKETLEKIKNKCIDIASKYVDLSQYEYSVKEVMYSDILCYEHEYYRYIDGIKTTEYCHFSYDIKGNILGFHFSDNGRFYKDFKLDISTAEKAIDDKLNELYSGNNRIETENGKVVHETINRQYKIFDGRLALVYDEKMTYMQFDVLVQLVLFVE